MPFVKQVSKRSREKSWSTKSDVRLSEKER